jgi:hypothetical protein
MTNEDIFAWLESELLFNLLVCMSLCMFLLKMTGLYGLTVLVR